VDWLDVARALARLGVGVEVELGKDLLPHPSSMEGFQLSLGLPRGQVADYRMGLEDGRCLHVVEYQDHYAVHLDSTDPSRDPLGHLLRDSPPWLALLAIAASLPVAGLKALARALRAVYAQLHRGLAEPP